MSHPYASDVAYLQDELLRLERLIESRLTQPRQPGAPAPEPTADIEAHIRERLAATAAAGRTLAVQRLAAEYELDRFEVELLLLALAPSLDLKFADLLDKVAYKYRGRTVDTALTILCPDLAAKVAARRYFQSDARLVRHHLLLLERDRYRGEEDILGLEVRLPRRVMNLFLGADALDESLATFSKLIEPSVELSHVVLPDEIKASIVRRVEHHESYLALRAAWGFDRVIPYGRGIVLLFAGPPGTGKTMLANALARHMGKRLLLVNADRLYDRVHTLESNVESVFREAKLQNSVLFFDECENLFADRRFGNPGLGELLLALERFDGVAVLATNLAPALDEAMDRRILLRVDFEAPDAEHRERIWRTHLPAEARAAADVDPAALAQRFELTGGYIKNAVLAALQEVAARAEADPVLRQADLLAACRLQLRRRLGAYADRVVPQLGLAAVVLPAPLRAQLDEVVSAVRNHATVFSEWGLAARLSTGRGLAVLLQGPPGTGKSLSAEAVAFELGKHLYRVSLPSVVSKYVGETEKNLQAAFAAARESQAVLFFDEADALFGRRTAVQAALDRYANMETNLLLQELERFDGLVLLATNLAGNIDPAFERRIAFKLVYPLPDAAARAAIWRGLLPEKMPQAAVDTAYLGHRFELSGGQIKNAVVKAAFRAARERGERRVVTTQLLARAADEELRSGFEAKGKIGFA
jgi:SpoVK/Ycf46/Vps4 family AAA+-type ATPase